MNVVPRTYHDRISLYPVQQIPRATAPPGRLRRKGLRPQPARPPRPGGGTAGSRAATRGVMANGRRSHPPSGHPVFRGCAVRKGNSRSDRRARRALVAAPPEAVPPLAVSWQTAAEAIHLLDTQFSVAARCGKVTPPEPGVVPE